MAVTWVVKQTLPRCEGEELDHLEGTVAGVEQAKRVAEEDPSICGFVHATGFGGKIYFKRACTGFHTLTPWRTDFFATRLFEWHYMQERVPVPKLLFIPSAMRGHCVPMMRLAEWFASRQPTYEVHVWLGGGFKAFAPDGATVHSGSNAENMDEWAAHFEEVFGELTTSTDRYNSMAKMVSTSLKEPERVAIFRDMMIGAARVIREVDPDVVVADACYTVDGKLPGLCSRLHGGSGKQGSGALFVQLDCPGQPGASMWEWLWVFLTNLGELGKIKDSPDGSQQADDEIGPSMAKPHNWPHLLPSCESMVRKTPSELEVCVGPFLRCPEPCDEQGGRQLQELPPDSKMGVELRAWLLNEAEPDPVIYVAFGTLVRLSQDFVSRFIEGLHGGPWRVLWSMPQAQQACLPQSLRECRGNWRVESFVPQAEVLSLAGVRVFVSHCGQNSTQEALSYGVPMVCVPFYCDQYEWAESVCSIRGAGVELDKLKSSPEQIRQAVVEVLQDDKYRVAARACADDMLRAQREAPEGECAGVWEAARVMLDYMQDQWQPRPSPSIVYQLGGAVVGLAGIVADGVSGSVSSVASWMGMKPSSSF